MKVEYQQLLSMRPRFENACRDIPGFDSVSITKTPEGDLALAVHILKTAIAQASVARTFEGVPVVVEPAGEFRLQ